MFGKNKTKKKQKWLIALAAIFFMIVGLAVSAYAAFNSTYKGKIYPGISIANMGVGGLTPTQVKQALNKRIDFLNQNGIIFSYRGHKTTLLPLVSSMEGDLAYQLINFNSDKAVAEAYALGRSGTFFNNLKQKINIIYNKKNISLNYQINRPEIRKILKNNFSRWEKPAQDAKLNFKKNKFYVINFNIEKEIFGRAINYEEGFNKLQKKISQFDFTPIILTDHEDKPQIYKKNCLNINTQAQKIISLAPLSLNYKKKKWLVSRTELAGWLALKKDKQKKIITIGLDENKVKNYLKNKISSKIDRPPEDGKFQIKNGRVIEFQASRDGLKLDLNSSVKMISYEFLQNKRKKADLVIKELKSAIQIANINDLGIKEIIGTGQSNFKGSPKNRRRNIKNGADVLNGVLIKPNEEFSLVKTLGEINAETGYLPELVIKNNRTIPEYGGGLCQIGTTMFRAALSAGLPITARRNHSYRVSYYEPAGTDATIYDPWPDLKFINDTGRYILIQSRIEGNDLYFDFWGTSDGRVATRTKPIIYNITKPDPTKYIETLDLKPGEKKCTEHAHNGADAYFNYKVKYPNGEIKEKKFVSHYMPWRAVCLIGVKELSVDEQSATSTPAKN